MILPAEGQMSLFDLDIWSGKTSPEPFPATTEKISEPSSKKLQKSHRLTPLFLDFRTASNGAAAASSWERGGGLSLGGYTTLSGGECLSDESESVWLQTSTATPRRRSYLILDTGEKPSIAKPSKLSQILEQNPNPKYNLSANACLGILRRAERRGKQLPEQLRIALEAQCHFRNAQESQGG